jgi:hypothetical protein
MPSAIARRCGTIAGSQYSMPPAAATGELGCTEAEPNIMIVPAPPRAFSRS